jgi:serine/threonine-protein kinase
MDATWWRRVEAVLDVALTREPAEWPGVLDRECAGDADLRREVEALLGKLGEAEGFLEMPPAVAAAALLAASEDERADRLVDRRMGPYRLVREVGRGGMSRVHLAERADGQFEQRVALKVLRPGLDSELDLERLRAERQILASLNHPNIARLLDGGVSDDGLPFLVLELVEGEPLDRYCTKHDLSIRQRLELFRTVIEATQYAHRNLVVHRDLKPSNVLVTRDGVVKLLDFGLAKLLHPGYTPGASPTTHTNVRWMTPEYAAPEQIRGETVTTSTDVYQLGAVLYELLSGRLPYGKFDNVHELERAVLERDPESLGGALRGDLDAIVARAMRKAPEERYASAQELGDDIQRYLSGYPVAARRHTSGYLTRQFVRRHRGALAVAAVLVIFLATYVITVAVDRARIARALTEATAGTRKAEQTTDFMLGLFEAAEGGQSLTDSVTARELLKRGLAQARELSAQPDLQAQMLDVIGRLDVQLGDYDSARPLLEEALNIRRGLYGENHADVATSLENLANVVEMKNDIPGTIALRQEALAIRQRTLGDTNAKTMRTLYQTAYAVHRANHNDEANRLFDRWLVLVQQQKPEMTAARADQYMQAAELLESRGKTAEAEAAYKQELAIRRAVYGPKHHLVGTALVDYATFLSGHDRTEGVDSLLTEAVSVMRAAYPDGHPQLASALRWRGQALVRMDRSGDAVAPLREALALYRRFLGPDDSYVANTERDLSAALARLNQFDEAERLSRDDVRIEKKVFGEHNAMVNIAEIFLADALRGEHRYAEAESLLLAAYNRFDPPKAFTRGFWIDASMGLVRLYETEGKTAEAEQYRTKLREASSPPGERR